jgi:hypothetical protein
MLEEFLAWVTKLKLVTNVFCIYIYISKVTLVWVQMNGCFSCITFVAQ